MRHRDDVVSRPAYRASRCLFCRSDMAFRTIRRIVLALFLTALCCGIVLYLLVLNPTVQRYGLNRVSQEIGYDLNTGNIRLRMGIKPGIHVQDILVNTTQGKALLSASELTLIPNLFDLFFSDAGTFFSGSIEAKNLKFQLAASGETKDYNLSQVIFQGKYDLNKRLVQIVSLKIIIPKTSLSATGNIQLSPTASPYLDLSVTSQFMAVNTFKSLLPTPLLPAWINRELLPVVKQGTVRVDSFSLRGNLKQIETLNLPEHANVLGLKLTLHDLVLQRNDPEFRDVSCTLSLEGGVFSLEDLSGRLWQSAFQNSSLVIPNTYADRLRYLIKAEANLNLSDMNHLKTLPWFSAEVQQKIQAIQTIDGTANIRVSAEYETGQAFPKIITSAVSLQSIQVTHPLLRLPLAIKTATMNSASDQLLKFSGRGLWGEAEFQVQGEYDLNKRRTEISSLEIITAGTTLSARGHMQLSPTASPYLDLSVTSPFMAVDTFKSLLPTPLLPAWINRELLPVVKQGNVRVDSFSLRGSLKQIETLNLPEHAKVLGLKLTLHDLVLQLPGRNAPELREISCALRLEGGAFSLNGLSGHFWQSAFKNASLVIPNIYADRLRYLVKTEANLALSDVNHLKTLSWFPADVQQKIQAIQTIDGTANIRVSAEYETGQAFPKIITSAVSLQSIQVTHPLLRLPLTLKNASIDSASDHPYQFSGSGLWGKTEFQVLDGSVDNNWRHLSARATARADVRELIELTLPHAATGNWIYGPLVAEGILNDDGVILDPARIDVGKGYLRFKGRQKYRSESGMHWINHIHIIQEPARNLFQFFKPGGNLLDGSVSLEGLLTLNASDGTGRFSGLNGHARLLVEKGSIGQTHPILRALALISLERILKPGSPGVQDGRLNFNRIEGEIEIEKGKILVQDLTFQSPAVNAAVVGTIDLNSDRLQLKIGLQPLSVVDSFVSNIPVIGDILTGKTKSLIVYSLEVTGSLSDPQTINTPSKNIVESALGYGERMVLTPERILKYLMDPRPQAPDYHAEFDQMTPAP